MVVEADTEEFWVSIPPTETHHWQVPSLHFMFRLFWCVYIQNDKKGPNTYEAFRAFETVLPLLHRHVNVGFCTLKQVSLNAVT